MKDPANITPAEIADWLIAHNYAPDQVRELTYQELYQIYTHFWVLFIADNPELNPLRA